MTRHSEPFQHSAEAAHCIIVCSIYHEGSRPRRDRQLYSQFRTSTCSRLALPIGVQLHAAEPLACNGGEAIDIVKKVVAPAPPNAFRVMLLEHDAANHQNKWIRSRLILVVQLRSKASQCGGTRHRGTDIVALTVRTFEACALRARKSTAKFYLDIIPNLFTTRQYAVSYEATWRH